MDRAQIGQHCLTLPAVTLDHAFGPGHDVYRVGGKMFAMVGVAGGLSFKATDIAYEVLTETGRAEPAPYLARAKWVHLADPDIWEPDDLADHLTTAHAIISARLTRKIRTSLELA